VRKRIVMMPTGNLPLSFADYKTSGLLLDGMARIDPTDTAILVHHAAYHCDHQLLDRLLSKGADPNCSSDNCKTPLIRLAYWWNPPSHQRFAAVKCIETLLARGADATVRDDRGATILHSLAGNADPEVVEKVLAAGADPNASDEHGRTLLMSAATPEIAELLKAKGASLEAVDRFGYRPVDRAAMASRTPLLEWFDALGHRPSSTAKMIGAILARQHDAARALVNDGVSVSSTDGCGRPLIYLASAECLPSVIEALLDRGADIDAPAPDGCAPLGACTSQPVAMGVPLEDIE
jgi:hypothetical protein